LGKLKRKVKLACPSSH